MTQIRLERLRKEFKEVVAVRDVTLTFPASKVTCLLGPSGCGKTTLLRMIAGLETPTAGEVYFDDQRVTDLPPRRRNIGMVFQYPVVYRGTSVYRNIELPLIEEKLSETERRRRIEEIADILGLQDSLDQDTTHLDIGTQQKVAVARTVARQADIIMFDEPLTNVDVNTKVQLKRALKQLTTQLRKTIIYVTHDQTDAMTLADEIVLMKDGVIVQCAAPRDLYNYPQDIFGGWFLGNPGMNFFEVELETLAECQLLALPLFKTPMRLYGVDGVQRITVGIRPERVRIRTEETPTAVRGQVERKSIVVGGQYLLVIRIGNTLLKAKVDRVVGQRVQNAVWVECPLDWITVFGPDGRRVEATLVPCGPED